MTVLALIEFVAIIGLCVLLFRTHRTLSELRIQYEQLRLAKIADEQRIQNYEKHIHKLTDDVHELNLQNEQLQLAREADNKRIQVLETENKDLKTLVQVLEKNLKGLESK